MVFTMLTRKASGNCGQVRNHTDNHNHHCHQHHHHHHFIARIWSFVRSTITYCLSNVAWHTHTHSLKRKSVALHMSIYLLRSANMPSTQTTAIEAQFCIPSNSCVWQQKCNLGAPKSRFDKLERDREERELEKRPPSASLLSGWFVWSNFSRAR